MIHRKRKTIRIMEPVEQSIANGNDKGLSSKHRTCRLKVSSSPPHQIRRRKSGGGVHDLPPVLARSRSCVVPLSSRHGTRVRVSSFSKTNAASFNDRAYTVAVVQHVADTLEKVKPKKKQIWDISNETLQHAPTYYPMEKSSIFLVGVPGSVLSDRIVDFVRLRSIFATFDSANASLSATSKENVKFAVKLWAKEDSETEGGGIIVEAQRISGCAIEFHNICRGLFDTARTGRNKGNLDAVPPKTSKPNPRTTCIEGPRSGAVADDADLRLILNMLEHPFVDTNELGMEALRFLTNPVNVRREDAISAANAIILGHGSSGAKIRDIVCSHLVNANGFDKEGSRDVFGVGRSALFEYALHMHNLALQILAYSLETMQRDEVSAARFNRESSYWNRVIPALMMDVNHALLCPHDAALAERCLAEMIRMSDRIKEQALNDGILLMMGKAYGFGKARYLDLETESLNLISVLSGVSTI